MRSEANSFVIEIINGYEGTQERVPKDKEAGILALHTEIAQIDAICIDIYHVVFRGYVEIPVTTELDFYGV
jgi:hypothetical protein